MRTVGPRRPAERSSDRRPPAPTHALPAVVTDLSIAATNQSMDSWDQAPAATELELI